MSAYFEDYITVGIFAAFGIGLVALTLVVTWLIRPKKPTPAKLSTYECGVDPVGEGWSQSYVRYFVYGLLFLIFDVEAIFIFPWALNIESFADAGQGLYVLVVMVLFIGTLLEGLIYAIRKGVLKWE